MLLGVCINESITHKQTQNPFVPNLTIKSLLTASIHVHLGQHLALLLH